AQFWAQSGEALFLLRFLIGMAVGIEYPVAGSLLVEFLPRRHRGPRLAMLTILWFAGAALAYIVGNLVMGSGVDQPWRYVLASPAVTGAVLRVIRLGTPESPRWLVGKGRYAEADRVIRKVYGTDFSLENLPEEPADRKTSLVELLRAGYGPRMFFVTVFW